VVLERTWWVGAGPRWGKVAMPYGGGFVIHHPSKVHYDCAKAEEVVLQIIGVGPSATMPVYEAGQPKK
jgi:hypothetical protein